MNAERTVTFAIEVPQDETSLVTNLERSGGLEPYFAVALDLTAEHEDGRYRVAFTPAEARELHTALGAALAEAAQEDGDHLAAVAVTINQIDVSKLRCAEKSPHSLVIDRVGGASLDLRDRLVEVSHGFVEVRHDAGEVRLDGRFERVVEPLHLRVELLDSCVSDGRDLRVDLRSREASDGRIAHRTSPSNGESAEPGLASDLSVEGEPAAGASNEEAPAAAPDGGYQRVVNPAALRAIRELAGMRGIDLARAAGISHGFLSNIEAGRKVPSVAVVHALARRLGVPIDAITQTT